MIPYIILHNSISLDGSLINFEVNMNLHYQIAGKCKPDAHLIGSNTIKTGIELYGEVHPEEKRDLKKPARNNKLPYWVIPDTKGILKGLLHEVRRFEFCKDIIIFISKETPKDYIHYLKERDYDFHIVGIKNIDLERFLEMLNKKYNVKTILTDTGKILGNLLINQGFIREISLLIHPVIVGKKSYNIFENINKNIGLKLFRYEIIDKDFIWLTYKVENIKN
ncbi:MAG: dihydrofolate reductase family protein [Thermoplasmatales archaeon]|nr:MAG: dihydrofolate reductase family protein [Thermoplasmatales archaeon]